MKTERSETMSGWSDDDYFALQESNMFMRNLGLANVSRVSDRWCACGESKGWDVVSEETAYYERENGAHGWFHDPDRGGCGGITQTG
jgi:hypothetical protein